MNDAKDVPEVPVVIPPPRFANPFQGLKGDPTAATLNCLMPEEAFKRVKRCRLESGTIQTTMNLLWIKLINLLEKKGINDYSDVREFEDAVQRSVLVLPEDINGERSSSGSTAPHADPEASLRDVATGAGAMGNVAESQPQQSDVPSDAPRSGGSRGKGKGNRAKRGKDQPKP